jgi:hypothetical protein
MAERFELYLMVLKSLLFPDILSVGREDFLGYPQICFVELLPC